MQFKTTSTTQLSIFVVLTLSFLITSCGSSAQYTGYDNDGIYGSNPNMSNQQVAVEQAQVTTSSDDTNYFENYFTENKAQLEAMTGSTDEIFTDPDSYSTEYTQRELDSIAQDSMRYEGPYGGWGQANDQVTINFIDNGWGAGWGWGVPLFGWGAGWGYGIPGFGWNGARPGWGWGWGYPGWGWGAGWGYPGWGVPGWAWGHPGYDYDFYRSRYSFVNSRRGLAYNSNLTRNRSTAAISRRDYTRTNNRLYNSSLNRRSGNTNARATTSRLSRGNNTRITRPNRTIRSSNYSRSRTVRPSSSRSSRSYNNPSSSRSVRSSSSSRSSRSSGSMRSSGGSRSSGSSMRSSGGGSRSSSSGRRGRG